MVEEENQGLSLKRRRVMRYFIEATENLIRAEGINNLSLREIAEEAGYTSSTIYNYFHDFEHLVLFASVRYLQEYAFLLAQKLQPSMISLDVYRTIYDCFNEVAFKEPEIFHNIFFGKYGNSLKDVLEVYYSQLFPEELEGLPKQIKDMLKQGTMVARDSIIMEELVKDGYVQANKAEKTLALIIAVHQNYIHEAMLQGESLDVQKHKEEFEELFEYILSMAV